MKDFEVYRLEMNGRTLASVMVEVPAWLPVRPVLPEDSLWLRQFVGRVFFGLLCG
jgi:hypothetical protein